MVVMLLYIGYAVTLQPWNEIGVKYKLFQGFENAFFRGLYVDDRTQIWFVHKLVMLWFGTAHQHQTLAHGLKGVHSGCVAVELVQDDITALHHLLVARKWNVLCPNDFGLCGIAAMQFFQCGEHDVRALVCASAALYANEEPDRLWCSLVCRVRLNDDGEGDVRKFFLLVEVCHVAGVILVQSANDAIAVVSNTAVQFALWPSEPFGLEEFCVWRVS